MEGKKSDMSGFYKISIDERIQKIKDLAATYGYDE